MRSVGLGGSGVEVTVLSLGTAPIGNLYSPVSDDDARATVDAAWDVGVRYFDTAPHYGLGLAERRLGLALRGRPREEFTVSTKVGRLLEPVDRVEGDDLAQGFAVPATHHRRWDFTADGVMRSIEASLKRLDLSRVDIVYLHDPDDHPEQALSGAYPALERLRSEGVVGAIGAGMNQAALLTRFLRETDMDVVLLAGRYSLLDQSGLDELLPLARERGASVVVGGVFNSGLLADPRPGATYDYATAPESVLERALRFKGVCAREGVPLRAAALRFPFGHPAVASVLLGARTAAEVRDAAAMLCRAVPQRLWTSLRTGGLLPVEVPVPGGSPT
ncbi:aldo/keto reductase [Wenjunlia tyrosinilytica]|uniref:Oxidoreductase n=1 Tax=Wenjunlia tyrosinilytica TaxID=1544741 RepID=A0A917ZTT7_9ACTN|nr:aldo/keto reductase [Wenjunlia tyrosinilytica]GGO92508.1 oxidoreductase [Wenjunlia tyrosinilytica]